MYLRTIHEFLLIKLYAISFIVIIEKERERERNSEREIVKVKNRV